jgi:Zn-finger nucleic acid-binding protein
MKKQRVRVSDDEAFYLDACPECDHVWLDGGELARLQMKFEQSAKAIDAFARQEQLQNLDDTRREAFQQQLDELPAGEHFLHAAGKDLVIAGTVLALLMATVLTYFYGQRFWSATFSLALAALLVWAIRWRAELSRNQRIAVLAAVAVIEILYLLLPLRLWW